MTIIIIAKAANKTAVNQWLRNNLGATGDNVNVPLIGIADPDDAEPSHYGTSWSNVTLEHIGKINAGVVNNPHVYLFTIGNFEKHIKDLDLRVKGSLSYDNP